MYVIISENHTNRGWPISVSLVWNKFGILRNKLRLLEFQRDLFRILSTSPALCFFCLRNCLEGISSNKRTGSGLPLSLPCQVAAWLKDQREVWSPDQVLSFPLFCLPCLAVTSSLKTRKVMPNFVALGEWNILRLGTGLVSSFFFIGVRVLGLNFLSSDTTSVKNEKCGHCGHWWNEPSRQLSPLSVNRGPGLEQLRPTCLLGGWVVYTIQRNFWVEA